MKKLILTALFFLLLTIPTALAASVPESRADIPSIPAAPAAPQIIRSVQSGDALQIAFDRALPAEKLLSFIALDGSGRETGVRYREENGVFTTHALPSGGQWLRVELAWVAGGVNATARYNIGGALAQMTRFDGAYNEFVYDSTGEFMEFRDAGSGIWTRFDAEGNAVRYSYADGGLRVWFDFAGNICWADYTGDGYACTWDAETGWHIAAPTGNIRVQLSIDPRTYKPLVVKEEPSPTPETVWYPNNTIAVAGLSLQEASKTLPDKWYNVVPVDLTRDGRQTYFLTISNARFIGECHVDVWGDEVTVTCDILSRSGIELKSEYGRWFTRLSQITAGSIESDANGFVFGEPVSISRDLEGADVALLFIRSKATYRQPFRDGTELPRYWRNKPDWKTFRENLSVLMKYVEK